MSPTDESDIIQKAARKLALAHYQAEREAAHTARRMFASLFVLLVLFQVPLFTAQHPTLGDDVPLSALPIALAFLQGGSSVVPAWCIKTLHFPAFMFAYVSQHVVCWWNPVASLCQERTAANLNWDTLLSSTRPLFDAQRVRETVIHTFPGQNASQFAIVVRNI